MNHLRQCLLSLLLLLILASCQTKMSAERITIPGAGEILNPSLELEIPKPLPPPETDHD